MTTRCWRGLISLLLAGLSQAAWPDNRPMDRGAFFSPETLTSDDPRRVPVSPRSPAPKNKIVLTGGRVFDATGATVRAADIVIDGKSIAAILPPGSRAAYPEGARVVDVHGKTVMPGLIDMHVHMSYLNSKSDTDPSEADATLRSIERLRYFIESGVTTVRDTGGRGMTPFRLKRWVQEDRLPLPRIFAAGDIITAKGGHSAEALIDRPGVREASGPDDWRQAVREQFEKGADFIKLASHYSREEVQAAIDEAHALGLRTTVDAETFYIEWAVRAGIDMVEHPLPRTDETIALMARNGVSSIPTLVPYIYIVDELGGYFGSPSRRFTMTKEGNFAMLQKLRKAGVKLGVGTDLVEGWYRYLPGAYITELEQFVAAGYTAPQALIAATRTNAELLDMGEKLGTLQVGKLADIIVVDGRPDEQLTDLERIDLVIRNGTVVVEDGRVFIPRHVPEQPPGRLTSHTKVVATPSGNKIALDAGEFLVPESRSNQAGHSIALPYYRLRSTAKRPATAIFLIAGGPGSSFIQKFDRGEMYDEVLFLREVADVVLYDQRGAGRSRPQLTCSQRLDLPLDRVVSAEEYANALRTAAAQCRAEWLGKGIDLSAYQSLESADDLSELSKALGYQAISLVGGSYGSHLSLTTIRRHPGMVERAVLYGLEGPDQTYDMPSGTLESLQRIAAAAERSPALKGQIPRGGLLTALEAVLDRVARSPQTIALEVDGKPLTVVIGKHDIQRVAKSGAHDLNKLSWAAQIIAMSRGDFTAAARAAVEARRGGIDSAMLYMMDCASGISPARRDRILSDPRERAAQQIVGDLNFEYFAACETWQAPDLGADFRRDLVADLPALLFQGTWDVSTPYGNALEIAPGFKNGTLVSVVGGTHATTRDLYQFWPPMKKLMADFLADRHVDPPANVELPAAHFLESP